MREMIEQLENDKVNAEDNTKAEGPHLHVADPEVK